jgi:predicted O-methyltransferase YrrM
MTHAIPHPPAPTDEPDRLPIRAVLDLDTALARLDIGPDDRSQISDAEAAFLFRFVRSENVGATLEIGCGLGKSAVAIMLATDAPHTVLDPFQANYDFRGLKNIERSGLADRLDFVPERSLTALPQLLGEERVYDVVFVDGSHRFDDILVDFTFADLLLRPGGAIVFDDLWMRTTQLVLSYIRTNRADYEPIRGIPRTLAAVRKVEDDRRDGMFHREFYTARGLVSHHAIQWLGTGDGRTRRTARRLKRAVYR